MMLFYEESKTVQFLEAESSTVGARGWGRGGELLFNGDKGSVWEDGTFWT